MSEVYVPPENGSFVVEREDGETTYCEYRYAKARFDAPGSTWAKLYVWRLSMGWGWRELQEQRT